MENKIYELLLEMNKKIDNNIDKINNIEILLNSHLSNISIKSTNNIVKKNIELLPLVDGFDFNISFIKECFYRNSKIADIKLLNKYYKQDNFLFPIKKENKTLFYYKDNKWNEDEDDYIMDTIINNLVNSYLTILIDEKDEDNDGFLNTDYYKRNLNYTCKLQETLYYKKQIIKEFLL